jgi:hypothetical protein
MSGQLSDDSLSAMDQKNISVRIVIFPTKTGGPAGKLASAEVLFSGDPLDGLRMSGFGIWTKEGGGTNVTFPARQYLVNGQSRTFQLLQPIRDGAQHRLRQLILFEYAAFEASRKSTEIEKPDEEFPDLPRP